MSKDIKLTILALIALHLLGCSGEDGRDAENGTDGLSSLVQQTTLPAGNANCPSGGVNIQSGSDLNNNATLDTDEVAQDSFVCNGTAINVLDPSLVAEGQQIFRFDTFGDEALWTNVLGIHTVIETGISPATALSVGIKVDADALPAGILDTADLNDPATTVALIGLNAVIGIQGTVENIAGENRLTSVGITCALCHSDVDDSVLPGIGKRLDGWPNRDINPGAIIALSPAMQDTTTQMILNSWGPGKYDAYWNQDGMNDPAVIPPAYGFNGIHRATYTGEGDISYWNAYVAVTQMGARGNFRDDDLGINIMVNNGETDQVTSKLNALKEYQFSLTAPKPPAGSFDPIAAGRGKSIFEGQGTCVSCHSGFLFTDANIRLHTPEETGTDDLLAMRSKTGLYRTTPLAGVWQRPPYFHNGSAASLDEVVEHYDTHLNLSLSMGQRNDLVEYLKTL